MTEMTKAKTRSDWRKWYRSTISSEQPPPGLLPFDLEEELTAWNLVELAAHHEMSGVETFAMLGCGIIDMAQAYLDRLSEITDEGGFSIKERNELLGAFRHYLHCLAAEWPDD